MKSGENHTPSSSEGGLEGRVLWDPKAPEVLGCAVCKRRVGAAGRGTSATGLWIEDVVEASKSATGSSL